MYAGNSKRNLKKKTKFKIQIQNFGCWPHFYTSKLSISKWRVILHYTDSK